MRLYTLQELARKKLILKLDGQPYIDVSGIRNRLRALGYKPNRTNDKGVLIYGISEEEIEKINSYEQRNNQS